MDFGLGLMGYDGSWDDAAFAEGHGFSSAGFVDSPLIGGDPFVAMGLAAHATQTMRLGTFLAIPSNRNAATTAGAIATVNKLAPGRVFLGIGTGYTGRQTFGLKAVSADKLRQYALQCRGLLRGEDVDHHEGAAKRSIRFGHKPDTYVDLEHPVPISIGADGPKALKVAGEVADELIVSLQFGSAMDNAEQVLTGSLDAARSAAADVGRDLGDIYTTWSTVGCVLEPGESPTSPRALEQIGAAAMMPFHTYALAPEIGDYLPPPIRDRIGIYEREVLSRFSPERRHQEVHRGHLSHLLDGEADVLTDEIVRMVTLTGTATEIAGTLSKLETAGLHNVSLWIPPHLTREVVVDFETQVMPLLQTVPAS